ncbi:PHB depolymerase family esterase [Achromobacter sp. GG226]|nr:PHB depolymerase family esterase [Verticiella sp. GG226]
MQEATRLTRAGDLTAATAAIQAALRGQPLSAEASPAAAAASAATSRRPVEADVIDVEVRDVRANGEPSASRAAGATGRGRPTPAHAQAGGTDRASDHVDAAAAQSTQNDGEDEAMATDPPNHSARSERRVPGIDLGHLAASLTAQLGSLSQAAGSAMPAAHSVAQAVHDPRFVRGTFTQGGDARDYKLYVPEGAGDRPLPLIVMLHGCTQDPDDFAAGTRMNALAAEQGFVVLYPEQSTRMNPQRCWNWFKHTHQQRGRGEPALIAGMTQDVMARYGIDPDRVYVAGLSAGGAMAAILGDTYSELFAAVGVHSGLASGTATDLPSALAAMRSGGAGSKAASGVPTIVFHGDADATVHPANGQHVIAASVGDQATMSSDAVQTTGGLRSTRRVYRVDDHVVAEHWLVHGASHAWSGGSPQGSYTESRGPDATREMLRFFREHVRSKVSVD